jgi:hypothetical protein
VYQRIRVFCWSSVEDRAILLRFFVSVSDLKDRATPIVVIVFARCAVSVPLGRCCQFRTMCEIPVGAERICQQRSRSSCEELVL